MTPIKKEQRNENRGINEFQLITNPFYYPKLVIFFSFLSIIFPLFRGIIKSCWMKVGNDWKFWEEIMEGRERGGAISSCMGERGGAISSCMGVELCWCSLAHQRHTCGVPQHKWNHHCQPIASPQRDLCLQQPQMDSSWCFGLLTSLFYCVQSWFNCSLSAALSR